MRPDQNIPFSGNNSFTGYSATPTCTLPATTGSIPVVAAKPCASSSAEGVAWNLVGPLTGNATIGFPSGLVDGLSIGFMINHGTGGYSASFASGYLFPSAATTSGQPTLTNGTDAVDLVVCQSVNAPLPGTTTPSVLSMWCGSPPLQMTSVSSWTLVGHAAAQSSSNAQTSGINTNASPGPATLILATTAYAGLDGTGTVSDSASNTWTLAIEEIRGGVFVDLYYVYSPSTSTNHTFTCVGTSNACSIAVQAWVRPTGGTAALDQSSGATTFTATSLSPGSITPLFPSELVVTEGVFESPITGVTISPIAPAAGGFTITDNQAPSGVAQGGAMAYLVQSLAAASNPTWSWTNTTNVAVSQASFR